MADMENATDWGFASNVIKVKGRKMSWSKPQVAEATGGLCNKSYGQTPSKKSSKCQYEQEGLFRLPDNAKILPKSWWSITCFRGKQRGRSLAFDTSTPGRSFSMGKRKRKKLNESFPQFNPLSADVENCSHFKKAGTSGLENQSKMEEAKNYAKANKWISAIMKTRQEMLFCCRQYHCKIDPEMACSVQLNLATIWCWRKWVEILE